MPGSLPGQPQEMNSSQPDNWSKVSYKIGRSTQDGTDKEAKQSEHWLNPTSTSNRHTALLEEEREEQQKAGNEITPKPPPVYITDATNISPLIQLLEQIAFQQYEDKSLAHNQVKVQPKTSESCRIIIKALTVKRTHFHTYKLKQETSYYSINPAEIKTEIENLTHTITNIWNIKQNRTKLPFSMFIVELKTVPNNKDISSVEYIQQCKIKFEPPKHKRDTDQCANCQRYGHTRNYCHLKPRCVKCAGDHLTNQCHRKERSSDARCVLCGGNDAADYRGCAVYRDLQKRTYPPLRLKQYTPPAQIKRALHTQPGVTYAQITKQNFYAATNIEQDPHINQRHQ
jgi:hypothetical protein